MTEQEERIKAALFRAHHRGGREADMIIGGFTQNHVHELSMEELSSLTELLRHDDHVILYWIEVMEAAPSTISQSLLQKMNNYAFTVLPLDQNAA